MDVDLDGATWRKSTYSNGSGGNCVEVADLPNGRAVRDSKRPEGPILVFTKDQWRAFVQAVEAGELRRCASIPLCWFKTSRSSGNGRRHGRQGLQRP